MSPSSIKILLIENNSGDAVFIQKLLKDVKGRSFKIRWVDCLKSAFSLIPQADFDIILLDLNLPDSLGLDTITKVYEKIPQIPIVVLTGIKDDLTALNGVKRGAHDYLSKEILNEDNLSRVIRYAVERNRIQIESRASKDKYIALFEKSNDAIFIHDLHGNILDVNQQVSSIFGYTKSELLSLKIPELHPQYALEESKSAFEVVKTKGHEVFEIDFKCKDGKIITTEVSESIFEIDGKKLVQGIVRDITERKIVENKLKLQDKALHSSVNGIVITELDGTIIWVNPAFTKVTGYESKEVIGKNPRILKSSLHDDKFYENMWGDILSGKVWQGELINLRKDGKLYFEEQTITPVKNDDGAITHFVGIKTDITERKLAEDTLKDSEQRFRSVAETATDAIVSVDSIGNITYFNRAAEKIFGFESKEVIGKSLSLLMPEKYYEDHKKGMERSVKTGDKKVIGKAVELVGRKKDGSEFPIELSLSSWMSGGETFLTSIIRDISERKRSEKALIESQKRYYNLFNNSLNGFALHEIVTNRKGTPIDYIFLEVNRAFEKLTGLKAKDIIGKKATEVIPGIEKDPFIEIYGKVALTGESVHFEQFASPLNRYYEIMAFSPQKGQFASVFMDITERKNAENQLVESEQRLRTIIEHSNELFYIHNTQHQLTYVSPQSKEIFGYNPEEMMVKWTTMTTDNPINDEGLRITERAIKSGETQPPYLLELKRKDGKSIIAEIDESPIKNNDGKVIGITGALRDITKRKLSEEALIESEEKFKNLAEQSPNMIFINQKGRIVYVNKKCEEMMGHSREEFYSPDFSFHSLIAPESLELIKTNFARHMKGEEIKPYEYSLIKRDGKKLHGIHTTKLINYQGEKAILGIVTDITDRKHVEEAMRQSEKKYRTLFEESKDVIYISSVEGKFLDINPAGVELFGYDSVEELKSINLAEQLYFNPEDRKGFQEELKDKQYVREHELELKKKDGQKLTVLITSKAVRDEKGYITSYRGFIRDITRQKQLEQQLLQAQKMEAMGTLAGGIAHDFNNILGAILGYTELTSNILDHSNGNDIVKRNLEQVNKAGLRAKDLIQQILTFSRKTTYKPQPLQIELIVQEALKLLRASTPVTIGIEQNIDNNCGFVLADPTQIHQVIMNLCTNAFDAVRENGGKIEVGLNKIEINRHNVVDKVNLPPGEYVQLTISDNGYGMNKKTVERIFDPFFTTKDAGRGTGLGLSVVHGIVKSHNGEITVWSELGKGSRFNIYLPALKTKKAPEQTKDNELLRGTESILYVDDEEALVQVNVQLLEKLGYKVTGNTDSREALEIFRESPDKFDLVISDQTMPGLTGVELATKLMEIKQDVPIILITGYSDVINRNKAKEMGIRDLVMKPILASDLSKTIRNTIDNQNGDQKYG